MVSSEFGPSLLLRGFQGIPSAFLSLSQSQPSNYIFQYFRDIDLLIYFTLTLTCWFFPLFKVLSPLLLWHDLLPSMEQWVGKAGQGDRKWGKKLAIYCNCSEVRGRGPEFGRCHWNGKDGTDPSSLSRSWRRDMEEKRFSLRRTWSSRRSWYRESDFKTHWRRQTGTGECRSVTWESAGLEIWAKSATLEQFLNSWVKVMELVM